VAIKCPKCNAENPDTVKFCGDCGTQLISIKDIEVTETIEAPMEELTRGTTFAGRYEIIEELGKGGMGRVYRVEDKKTREELALKLIKPEISAEKKTIERFTNELRLAHKISHRNVCRMYHLGESKGTSYITMEYVPGEDLRSSIRRFGQLPIGKSISIAKQVCEGLDEAHRLGVVHRDLKSSNIMIDKEGNVRIMDFGIARSLEAKGITGAGVIIGTPEYMSPEQVEGKEVDQRSDIYSLGVILYEMVTGRVPFEGDTPFTIGMKHKGETPKDPKELNTQISDDLNNLILKCMEKEKDKRYQSAEDLNTELTNIEKGIPTTERIIPERKPLTSREITVQFSLKKLFIPTLIVIAVAVVGLILWQILPKKKVAPLIPSGKPSLAVMYFKNNTGDENYDTWRSALSDSIITDLSQSKYMNVLSGDRLYSILRKLDLLEAESYASEDLLKVAAEGGVNHILQGGLSKAGDIFRIDYTLQDIDTGEIVGSDRVEGKGEESIFSMVDELTRRIKTSFRLSTEEIASDIDKDVGKITTNSPEAFKYYSEGKKYHYQGDLRQGVRFYKMATEIDPEFAMAYRAMASAYSSLRSNSEMNKYFKKAFELSDRVSDRERYHIEGQFYSNKSEKTWDKAIDAFNKLLELYSDDWVGRVNLGIIYNERLEEFDKAIELFEVPVQNKVEAFHPYANLASVYWRKGMYDRSTIILENSLDIIGDNSVIRYYLARNYLYQGKYDLALAEADKSLSLDPALFRNFWIKGDSYLCKEDLVRAEKEFLKLLESDEKPAHLYGRERLEYLYIFQGMYEKSKEQAKLGLELAEILDETGWKSSLHLDLAYLHLKSKNIQAALEQCNKALSTAVEAENLRWERRALHTKGITYLQMNSLDEAQRTARELKELIERGMHKKAIRLYHHLMGFIELEMGNFSRAIDSFKKAISLLYPSSLLYTLFIDPLALAYYKSGDLEKAREEYERIIARPAGRLYYGDIYAKSFYMLGKIHEQQGDTAKAIEHYDKFLDLWKDADPGIAEVEDAKKMLAGLKEECPEALAFPSYTMVYHRE
jgi:serine/threonine protein kinase/Flp pilus assembly protein TadD